MRKRALGLGLVETILVKEHVAQGMMRGDQLGGKLQGATKL